MLHCHLVYAVCIVNPGNTEIHQIKQLNFLLSCLSSMHFILQNDGFPPGYSISRNIQLVLQEIQHHTESTTLEEAALLNPSLLHFIGTSTESFRIFNSSHATKGALDSMTFPQRGREPSTLTASQPPCSGVTLG